MKKRKKKKKRGETTEDTVAKLMPRVKLVCQYHQKDMTV